MSTMESSGNNSPMHKKVKLDPTAPSAAATITDENSIPIPVVDKKDKTNEAIVGTKAMETNDQDEEEDEEEEEEEEEEEDEDEDICLDILGNAALALEDTFVVDGTYPCTKVEIDFLDTTGKTCTVEFPGRFKSYNKDTNSTEPNDLCSTLLSASDASPFVDNSQVSFPSLIRMVRV